MPLLCRGSSPIQLCYHNKTCDKDIYDTAILLWLVELCIKIFTILVNPVLTTGRQIMAMSRKARTECTMQKSGVSEAHAVEAVIKWYDHFRFDKAAGMNWRIRTSQGSLSLEERRVDSACNVRLDSYLLCGQETTARGSISNVTLCCIGNAYISVSLGLAAKSVHSNLTAAYTVRARQQLVLQRSWTLDLPFPLAAL